MGWCGAAVQALSRGAAAVLGSPAFPRAHALALAALVGLGPALRARADPHSLLASPHNLLEARLVASAGGWTTLLLGALLVAAWPLARPGGGALLRAVGRWAVGVALARSAPLCFAALEAVTGRCVRPAEGGILLLPHGDPRSCRAEGHRWEGFGASPQAFALVHCGLGLAEEAGALGRILYPPQRTKTEWEGPDEAQPMRWGRGEARPMRWSREELGRPGWEGHEETQPMGWGPEDARPMRWSHEEDRPMRWRHGEHGYPGWETHEGPRPMRWSQEEPQPMGWRHEGPPPGWEAPAPGKSLTAWGWLLRALPLVGWVFGGSPSPVMSPSAMERPSCLGPPSSTRSPSPTRSSYAVRSPLPARSPSPRRSPPPPPVRSRSPMMSPPPARAPPPPGTALGLLFLLNAGLVVAWQALLAVTLAYRHDWPRNAAGAAAGWAAWALTYRLWYRRAWSPGPPGVGGAAA
ncbi:fat storage-inducing transmembrane protein 1 [Rhynochetos jubatus]